VGSLSGKVAIVTGASRGLGRRFAAAIAAEGARVALLARPSDQLGETAREIGEAARAIPCDVSDPDSVRAAFAEVQRQFGRLDILINNAGVTYLNRIETASDAKIQGEVSINVMGPIFAAREAIPMLRAAGGGDIVNISSESVKLPFPYLTIYGATKAALEYFTRGLRDEVRPDSIRVTALRVGSVMGTELHRHWDESEAPAFMQAMFETGIMKIGGVTPLTPDQMAMALISVLALPHEVNVDLIEVRPTAP